MEEEKIIETILRENDIHILLEADNIHISIRKKPVEIMEVMNG